MRFSPNPNNLRPIHYENDTILDEYVNMYEYVNCDLPQKPYFIISNPIGIELEYIECILEHILRDIRYTIEHDTYDNIMHIVLNGIYFHDGKDAQQFHDMIMNLIPDKIATSFLEIRHNSRLVTRYVKLISMRTSITNIKIEDIEFVPTIPGTWYKLLYDYLWSIHSYLIPHSNNPSKH